MADPTNQAEHQQISTALEVETLEVNLFRSINLFVPANSRGVFGGQVISQALVAATNCVDPAFGLHSLHCYFLTSASPATPIVYYVERLRDGRSYCARSVKAAQRGQVVFTMLCSFQKPEPWQPSHHWPMPANVPTPEECEPEDKRYTRMANQEGIHPRLKAIYLETTADRIQSPIECKVAQFHVVDSDIVSYMYWLRARNIPPYAASYRKCILAYMSDFYLIGTAGRILGLKSFGKGPNAQSMASTIDHSIYFYYDDFDVGDWLLYVVTSPRAGSGRAVASGRLYTRSGTLVAIVSQEGVLRADIRNPTEAKQKVKL